MGLFAQRQAAYTPPFDGSKPTPTLIGGGTHPPSAASEDQLAKELGVPTLPLPANGTWKIQLREYPVTGHRSHAVLALIGPDGKTVRAELNGLGNSRDFGKDESGPKFYDPLLIGPDGSKLLAHSFDRRTSLGENSIRAIDIASGSYDDIVRGAWQRGIRAAYQINRGNFDYKSHDPAYEFGGSGGEIQNSDSVAFTLGKAMSLDLNGALRREGMERRFSGWGRDLLDPGYKRYVAPPTFPNPWTP